MLPFVEHMIDDRLSLFLLAVVLETDPNKVKAIVSAWKSLQWLLLSLPNGPEILRVFKNTIRKFVQHIKQPNPTKYFSSYRRHYRSAYHLDIVPIPSANIHIENLEYLVPQDIFTTSVYGIKYLRALQSKITDVSKYQKQLRKYLQGYEPQTTTPPVVQANDNVSSSFRKFKQCMTDISRIRLEKDLVRIDETLRRVTEASLKKILQNDNRNVVKLVYEMNNFVFNTEQILYCLYNFGHTYAPNESGAIMMQSLYQLYQPYWEKLFQFISTTNLTGILYATQFLKLYKPIDEMTYYMHRSPDVETMKTYNIQVAPQNSFPVCFTKKDISAQVAQFCRRQPEGNFSNCYKQKTNQSKLQFARACLIQENLDPACAKIIGNSNGFFFLQIVQNLTRMKLLLNDFVKYLSKTEFVGNEKKEMTALCDILNQYSNDVYAHAPLAVQTISNCRQRVQQSKQIVQQQPPIPSIPQDKQQRFQMVQPRQQPPIPSIPQEKQQFKQVVQPQQIIQSIPQDKQQRRQIVQPLQQQQKQRKEQASPSKSQRKESELQRVFARLRGKRMEQKPETKKKIVRQQIPVSTGNVKQLITRFEKEKKES